MENITLLNQNELIIISGGNFAWDAGWLLGNIITGSFVTPYGTVDAMIDYAVHYA